jgi:hypothetical protein
MASDLAVGGGEGLDVVQLVIAAFLQRHDAGVQELVSAGELGQVPPDDGLAQRMLEDAGRHLATATVAASSGDLPGAYQLAYDALRKRAASLLEAQETMAARIVAEYAIYSTPGPGVPLAAWTHDHHNRGSCPACRGAWLVH